MPSYVTPKRATEYIFYVGLVSQSTGQFQVNPTIASGDWKISKDGGAFANLATLPAVTPAGGRAVKVTLSSTEMTADNVIVQGVDAAGDEWDEVTVLIQTTASQIDDLATAAALATVQADTDNIQTRLPAALSGDGFIKADLLSIGDELVNGNNATLNLKKFNVVNNAGDAFVAQSTGSNGRGIFAEGHNTGPGIYGTGGYGIRGVGILDTGIIGEGGGDVGDGIAGYGSSVALGVFGGHGIGAYGQADGDGIHAEVFGGNRHGINSVGLGTGKSINAPQDIALPSGDLDDQLQAIDNFIDTEIAAIKAKTDNLPADPADASDIAASFTTVNSKLDTIDDFLDTEVAAIKTKTDQLTFTAANQVDANIQSVNDTALIGDGSVTPWGPA